MCVCVCVCVCVCLFVCDCRFSTTAGTISLKLARNIAGDPRMFLFKVWYQSDERFPSYGHFIAFCSVAKVYIWQLKVSFHLFTLSCHFFPKLIIIRRPPVWSNWNLPGILPGPRGCALSRFDINRTSGSQVTAIYLSTNDRTRCYDITNDVTINVCLIFFARLTSQFFFFFVWYDVTIDTGDLSMWLFKVWYRSSSSISAVSQVSPKVWKLFFPKVWINCSNY